MRHNTCRKALLEGELDPEIAEHLDECQACRRFSEDLALVSSRAAEMSPGPAPAGLADRVLARVRAEGNAETQPSETGTSNTEIPGLVPLPVERPRPASVRAGHRQPLFATTAIAAVLILVVGVLAVLPSSRDSDDEASDPLLVAAQRTAGAETARIRVSGSVSMDARFDPGALPELPTFELEAVPDFPEPPAFEPPPLPDLSGIDAGRRAEIEARFQASIEAARQRHEDYVRRNRERIAELRADSGAALERARARVPREFSFDAAVRGEGTVEFGRGLALRGAIELGESGGAGPEGAAGEFWLSVAGPDARYRGTEGQWIAVPDPTGPLGTFMLDPDGVTRFLRDARAGVEDLGDDEIEGRRVRHYRFGVDSAVFGPDHSGTDVDAEAWIDDDEVLRRLTVRSTVEHDSGPMTGEMTTVLTLDLYDFGADVSIEAPPAQGRASSPLGPAALLYPFHSGFSVSFYSGLEVPAPPTIDLELPEFPELPELPVIEPPALPDFPTFEPPPAPEFHEPEYEEQDAEFSGEFSGEFSYEGG